MTHEETAQKEINLALALYFSKIEEERQKAEASLKAMAYEILCRDRALIAYKAKYKKLRDQVKDGPDNEALVAQLRARVEELQEIARQLRAERDAALEQTENQKPRLYY
jgi:hypothetical protein